MKTCPHCHKGLLESSFFSNRDRPDGCSILCKPCHRAYEGSPSRRATRTWNTIKSRVGPGKQASYVNVEVRMTRQEYIDWALPAFEKWMAENPGLTPSVDRIRSAGHYEIGNVRILERGQNSRLASGNMNVHAPEGKAWCSLCKRYLDKVNFQRCASAFNGLQKRCRPCQNNATSSSARALAKSRRASLASSRE